MNEWMWHEFSMHECSIFTQALTANQLEIRYQNRHLYFLDLRDFVRSGRDNSDQSASIRCRGPLPTGASCTIEWQWQEGEKVNWRNGGKGKSKNVCVCADIYLSPFFSHTKIPQKRMTIRNDGTHVN
jgi:hypothetical protein